MDRMQVSKITTTNMSQENACIEAICQTITVITMYSRPLVGRLKTRLSVNFVHKNSQTVYNSKV